MAQKRMFSLKIVDSDAFLEMPMTSQLLYFHLAMRADDEGFIGNAKSILRMIGCSNDDLKILIAKRFILIFESGVIVIKHWQMHNTIRMDRFNNTNYQREKSMLVLKENKSYTEIETTGNIFGNQMATQVKLSKVKLSKDICIPSESNNEKRETNKLIFDFWNEQGITKHIKLTPKMETKINSSLKTYSLEEIKQSIKTYGEVLNGKEYFWNYKWTLDEFLARGLTKFLDVPKSNFLSGSFGETKKIKYLDGRRLVDKFGEIRFADEPDKIINWQYYNKSDIQER
jgi:hypothetical protein